MKNTENSQKNVLIIGSGSMGYGDQRIHDMWIDKFNLFSKVEHESLPLNVFKDLGLYLWNHLFNPNTGRTPVHLFLRQADPGLGICIPQDNVDNGFSFREESDPLEKIYLEGLDK